MKTLRRCFRFFPFCLLISSALTAVPFLVSKIYYMYADDYLMNYIANGSYGTEYSDHLIFPRILFGTVTKLLYGITRSVNWYAVLLAATLAVSFAVFHWVLASFRCHLPVLAASVVLNAVAVPLFFTFTVVAFLCVGAGAALLYLSFYRKKALRTIIPGVLLMIWGYVVRKATLVPVLGLMSPFALKALVEVIRAGRKRREAGNGAAGDAASAGSLIGRIRRGDDPQVLLIRRLLLLVCGAAAALVLLLGLRLWEQKAYSGDMWAEYQLYNTARSDVLDYPGVGYDILKDSFREIGFTSQEYQLLYRWAFCEKKVFSRQKFLEIAAVQSNIYSKPWRTAYTKQTLKASPNRYLLLIPLVLFLLLLFADRRFQFVTGFLGFLMLCAVILALCFLRMRFLLRVSVPLSIVTVYVTLMCTGAAEETAEDMILLPGARKRAKKSGVPEIIVRAAGFCAAAAVLVLFCVRFVNGYNNAVFSLRNPDFETAAEPLFDEVRSHPERIYITSSYCFGRMYYYGHPVNGIRTIDDYSHLIRVGSWDSFTPRYYRIAEELGIQDPDNLISGLVTEDSFYLLTDTEDVALAYLKTAFKGSRITAEAELIGDGPFKVVKFTKEDA